MCFAYLSLFQNDCQSEIDLTATEQEESAKTGREGSLRCDGIAQWNKIQIFIQIRDFGLKSVNLQYNMLVCRADETNELINHNIFFSVSLCRFLTVCFHFFLIWPIVFFFFFYFKIEILWPGTAVFFNFDKLYLK